MIDGDAATDPRVARNLFDFVKAIFAAWTDAGVRFIVLRNYEALPDHVDNDIDILVLPAQRQLSEGVLVTAATATGYRLHNRAEFTPVSLFFYRPGTLEQVQVDLFTSLGLRILPFLSVPEVLERSVNRGLFSVPHPIDGAIINLLTRLLYKGHVRASYRDGILTAFRKSPDEARASLTRMFGSSNAESLVGGVLAEDWSGIEASATVLRRTLLGRQILRNPVSILRGIVRDGWRLLRRWLRPPGLSVVLLGPDGCGKSSVTPLLIQRLRHSFAPDKGLTIHWKPAVFFRKRRANRPPSTDPHGSPPRSTIVSLLFLAYHWLEYFLGALLQIHPVKFRNGLIVIDRHYYDFLVDPLRYRLNAPAWAVRLGAALLPKPDLVFLLDASTHVLQSRKQEVSAAETSRQREVFLALVKTLKNGHVVDANRSLDDVVADIAQTILQRERRIGAPAGE